MGAPKQKWTQEEEAALRAGVNKHGTGKWSNIQKDPEFNPYLSSRSNIDLKDKWRNMCVSAGGQGSREKVRIPKLKALPAIPSSSSQRPASPAQVKQDGPSTHRPASPAQVKQDGSSTHRTASPAQVNQDGPSTHRTASHAQVKHDGPSTHRTASPAQVKQDGPSTHKVSLKNLQDGKTPRCSAGMIIEALTEMHEPSGVEIGAMCSYIEQKHEVSLNRRLLTSKLRRLVQLNKIEKVQKGFKLKETSIATSTPSPEQKDPPHSMKLPQQSEIEELAANVAYKVADWDAKSFLASEAVKEAERIERMEEETDCLLTIAREIFEQCSRGQIITMA